MAMDPEMSEAWLLGLVGLLAVFTGIASAALAVSAFTILLPVLTNALGMHVLDALFICLVLDTFNGLLIFARYRDRLSDPSHLVRIACVAILAGTVASATAVLIGARFLSEREGEIKYIVAAVDFAMAIGFTVKYYKLRSSRDVYVDAELSLPALAIVGVNANPDLERTEEAAIHPQRSGTPEALGHANAPPQNVGPAICNRVVACGLSVRLIVSPIFVVLTAMFGGLLGFGGGNAFAVFFILTYGWSVLSATGASGLISGLMTLSLAAVFFVIGEVNPASVRLPLAVVLPCDIVSVLIATRNARALPEKTITLSVAVLFLTIGVFATVYASIF